MPYSTQDKKQTQKKSNQNNTKKAVTIFLLLVIVALIITIAVMNKNSDKPGGQQTIYNKEFKLSISEICSDNTNIIIDQNGEYSDYIEFINEASEAVNIEGCILRIDDKMYTFPSVTIEAGQLYLFFLTNDVTASTGIELDNTRSQEICFFTADQNVAFSYTTSTVQANQVAIKTEDKYILSNQPSPGYTNDQKGIDAFIAANTPPEDSPIIISEILMPGSEIGYAGALNHAIEITNVSQKSITLNNWFISNDAYKPDLYRLPSISLEPGKAIVLVADGKNTQADGYYHTNFTITNASKLYFTSGGIKYTEIDLSSVLSGIGSMRGKSIVLNYKNGDFSESNCEYPSLGFENTENGQNQYATFVRPSGISFSEAVSSNESFLKASNSTYNDFIELYNNSDNDITLSGLYITDNVKKLTKAALPSVTVKARSFLTVICSSTDTNIPSGYNRVDFSLSAIGETVYITDGKKILDTMVIPTLGDDESYGRPAGTDKYAYLTQATPNKLNAAGLLDYAFSPEIITKPGIYNNVSSVSVAFNSAIDGTIYYTLDCSEPTSSSLKYTGPITLTKTTIIRAVVVQTGKRPSKIQDYSFIINENHSTMGVVSLVTTPWHLWDNDKGIYVFGDSYKTEFPYSGANFHQDWEYPASIGLYETNGVGFDNMYCGVRLFGAYSRAIPAKSFACFFRGKYGVEELNYPLFGENYLSTFNSIVLRNCGQDWNRARMRDPLVAKLAIENGLNVDCMNMKPVVLYLNGEYWGCYYVREKLNEDYVANHYDVDDDEVTVLVGNAKSDKEYQALVTYIKGHDMKVDEYYEYVASQMDIDNYIDYVIAEIACGNTDHGNIRFYKYPGGKWRWMLYDVDWGLTTTESDCVYQYLNPKGNGVGDMFSTAIITGLLKRPEFRDKFLRRMAWQMTTVWTEENYAKHIAVFQAALDPEVQRDYEKWNAYINENDLLTEAYPVKYSRWLNQINTLKSKIEAQYPRVYKGVKNFFDLTDSQMVSYGFTKP